MISPISVKTVETYKARLRKSWTFTAALLLSVMP